MVVARQGFNPHPAAPAVLPDAVGTVSNGATATSFNYTGITVGSGNNRALLVFTYHGTGSSPTSIVLTWDSGGANQAMTHVGVVQVSGARLNLYALLNPTPGNKTLNATWTTSDTWGVGAISFTGVLQTSIATAFINANSGTYTTVTNPSLTITTSNPGRDMVVASIVSNQTITPAGFNVMWNGAVVGAELGEAEYTVSGGASVTFNWTLGASTSGSYSGVEIVPA